MATSTTLPFAVVAAALSSDPREVPLLSRRAGFAGVLFHAYSPALDIPALSTTGRREFRQVLSSQDQQLVGLDVEVGPKGFGPGADVDRVLARLGPAMEAAAGLLAPLVCVDLGPLPEPPAEARPKPTVTPEQAGFLILPTFGETREITGEREVAKPRAAGPDPAFVAQVDAALTELGVRADRYGVTLAFRSELSSLAALERALRAARCPWFGVDLDPVAVLRDDWPADDVFSRLGGLVRHVRGRDAVGGAGKRTKPAVVGRGDTNWGELLSNLDAAGYRAWLTVDPMELTDRAGAAVAALEHLKAVRS